MSNQDIKKWSILIGGLLITLLSVWNAPEPVPEQSVVQVRHEANQHDVSEKRLVTGDDRLQLKQRQVAASAINLFDVPKRPEPVKPVVRKPIKLVTQTVRIPFSYVGMLRQHNETTLFLMSGPTLYLVQQGDVVKTDYKLQSVDIENKQLEWLYLPLNQIHKMSIEQ